MTLAFISLAAFPSPARADGYTTTVPTGGMASNGTGNLPYSTDPNTGLYGGGVNSPSSSTCSCGEAITTTYAWMGMSPAPQSVIVTETATATASALYYVVQGGSGSPMASGSDGIGDMIPITTRMGTNPSSVSMSGTVTNTRYTMKSGGSPVTLTSTPTAMASDPSPQVAVSVSVGYKSSLSPVTISIEGAQKDTSGNYDILVGQLCAPVLQGGPSGGSFSNVNWTVNDSRNTFQSWSDTTLVPANP